MFLGMHRTSKQKSRHKKRNGSKAPALQTYFPTTLIIAEIKGKSRRLRSSLNPDLRCDLSYPSSGVPSGAGKGRCGVPAWGIECRQGQNKAWVWRSRREIASHDELLAETLRGTRANQGAISLGVHGTDGSAAKFVWPEGRRTKPFPAPAGCHDGRGHGTELGGRARCGCNCAP
jgi:hypothetical protein